MASIFQIILLSFFSLGLDNIEMHEFHLSKCEIHYSQEDSALQISLRIFIDDLEEAITNVLEEENLKLCTKKEAIRADSVMVEYLSQTFVISVDNVDHELQFIGKEVSEDLLAVWCYFEVTEVVPDKLIEVDNKILIETFDDQSNLVSLNYSKNIKEHFLLQKGKTVGTLDLK